MSGTHLAFEGSDPSSGQLYPVTVGQFHAKPEGMNTGYVRSVDDMLFVGPHKHAFGQSVGQASER